ncbi:hypothetical protein GGS21DRAFT_413018 [Xylaria nigripes]|nr:hypothetical protein GGS21DRAFT_413018 [Xylaria nigripes]
MAAQDGASQNDQDTIPVLTSISPSIFVPTDRDFTQPAPPVSDDPITRLEATIEALDWHAARVEDNMVAMLVREAQRVRRAGQVERVQYDSYRRPIKDQRKAADTDLLLEERIIREDSEQLWRKDTYKRNPRDDDAGRGRRDPREARPPPRQPAAFKMRSPEPESMEHEYIDLATLRRDKMVRLEVDEFRQTPRSAALTHVLNLVKWGWDDQLEGHRTAVRKEKEDLRANLHRKMKENPFSLTANRPPTPTPQLSRPTSSDANPTRDDPMNMDS